MLTPKHLFFSFLFYFSMTVLLVSCQETHKTNKGINPKIHEFKIDSTSIRAIQVIDKNTVYFAGSNGRFGYTTDAGKTWIQRMITFQDSIQPSFRSIAFNGTAFFVLSIENPALLYRIHKGKTQLVYKETHPKVFYDAMAFFDKKNGIAMGDPTGTCLSIITTNDGGGTWKKKTCSQLPEVAEGEAAFAASNTNIKIIDKTVWLVTGGKKARVFKSTNQGISWKVYDTPILQGEGAQGIYSVDFYDKNNGIIFGGDYSNPKQNQQNKAMTKDGGETWQLIAQGQDPNYRSCVKYLPNSNGKKLVAVGIMGISFSNDAGQTWKKISDASYFTLQFVDEHTAWLGGSQKIGLMQF